MSSEAFIHTCHGVPENTFSALFGNDPRQNQILKKIDHSDVIKEFQVYCPVIALSARPGQFVIVRGDERSERVPLTIADYDRELGIIVLVLQVVGLASHKLNEVKEGDKFRDIVGPLGHPTEIENFGTVVCIGGGLGIAPIHPIQRALDNAGNRVVSIIGARTGSLLFWEERLESICDEFYIMTDDGTKGQMGLVTEPLQKIIDSGEKIDRVFAIGPPVMMRAVAEVTRPYGIKTVVSLNSIMIDGTGMCGGCRVEVGGEVKFTCVDGPEFDAHEVNFPVLLNRLRAFKDKEDDSFKQHQFHDHRSVIEARGRVPMPEQPISERIGNFSEVALGYKADMARAEAARCLQCKNPSCVQGCPVNVDIPGFIREIVDGRFLAAAHVLKRTNTLPAICGRVCPQERQCEARCVLGQRGEPIAIGNLERFAADAEEAVDPTFRPFVPPPTGKRIAIVGSGPAGLSVAADLAKMGHKAVIFEALHTPGGVLAYGIPEFRLPKSIVKRECDYLAHLGVEFKFDVLIGPGPSFNVRQILDYGFDAVFIGSGAGLPYFLNIPGENLNGVFSSNEILTRVNLMKAYRFPDYDTPVMIGNNVCVCGGGNVAMDVARCMVRLGSWSVTLVYRRTKNELPARKEEIQHALEEGVKLLELTTPVEVLGDDKGWVKGIRCQKMELSDPDSSGRRSPVPVEGSEHIVPCDELIVAVGNRSNPVLVKAVPGLALDRRGNIIVDANYMTSLPGLFAGGDIVTGAATVIDAMGAGKKAAIAIDVHINDK